MTKRSYLHAGRKPKVSRLVKIDNRAAAHYWNWIFGMAARMYYLTIRSKLEAKIAQAQVESKSNQPGG